MSKWLRRQKKTDSSLSPTPMTPDSPPPERSEQSWISTNLLTFKRSREQEVIESHVVTDALGLNIIHAPDTPHTIDIIFVHGLGGTSQQTWSRDKDPSLFWPKEWLPFEPGMSSARMLSFGYNARFTAPGYDNLNISDFARELLFEMKFGTDDHSISLEIGRTQADATPSWELIILRDEASNLGNPIQVPIIFIAHSLGGLVVKKAFILGQNDTHYNEIVQSISGIVFLATPHRGMQLAQTLNKILQVAGSSYSAKEYINELQPNSTTLQDINDQFRNIAANLSIVSFIETRLTNVTIQKMMVVERHSATLGYVGEITKLLDANHHGVCKYSGRQDSNYKSVSSVIRSLVDQFKSTGTTSGMAAAQGGLTGCPGGNAYAIDTNRFRGNR